MVGECVITGVSGQCCDAASPVAQVTLLLFDTGRLRDCNSQISCRRVYRRITKNCWLSGQFSCFDLTQAHVRPCSAGVPSWAVSLLVSDRTSKNIRTWLKLTFISSDQNIVSTWLKLTFVHSDQNIVTSLRLGLPRLSPYATLRGRPYLYHHVGCTY